jgi:hypothetical protein
MEMPPVAATATGCMMALPLADLEAIPPLPHRRTISDMWQQVAQQSSGYQQLGRANIHPPLVILPKISELAPV